MAKSLLKFQSREIEIVLNFFFILKDDRHCVTSLAKPHNECKGTIMVRAAHASHPFPVYIGTTPTLQQDPLEISVHIQYHQYHQQPTNYTINKPLIISHAKLSCCSVNEKEKTLNDQFVRAFHGIITHINTHLCRHPS